jgi:hypothetical protein
MPCEDVVVLANSRKLGGRCVAGICLRTGRWIRPVSTNPHGELDDEHASAGGRLVRELDVVRMEYEVGGASPRQPENVLVTGVPWELRGSLSPSKAAIDLRRYTQKQGRLLGNRGRAVPESEADKGVEKSLTLVEPRRGVVFRLRPADETQGKLKPKACFTLSRNEYELNVTDYMVAPRIRRLGIGDHRVEDLGLEPGRVLLTVSLGEPQEGWCTKLVAGIVILPR